VCAHCSGACAQNSTYRIQTTFSGQDFQPWAGSGPAKLHGQAFLRTVGGDVKTCAGARVILAPANAFDRELIQADQAGYGVVANGDPRAGRYFRAVTCDAQGNFSFTGLPALPWVIETEVTWSIPNGGVLIPDQKEGGILTQEVNLAPGDNQAILSHQ